MDPRLQAHAAAFWDWSDEDVADGSCAKGFSNELQNDSSCVIESAHTRQSLNQSEAGSSSSTMLQCSSTSTSVTKKSDEDEEVVEVCVTAPDLWKLGQQDTKLTKCEMRRFMSCKGKDVLRSTVLGKKYENEKENQNGKKSKKASSKENGGTATSDDEKEKTLQKQDRELDDLLKSSKLIEQYATDQNMYGRNRQRHVTSQLVELGMQAPKSEPVTQENKKRIIERRQKLNEKAVEIAKERGIYDHTLKSTYKRSAAEILGLVKEHRGKSRSNLLSFSQMRGSVNNKAGIAAGGGSRAEKKGPMGRNKKGLSDCALTGKFKGGSRLHLSKRDIETVESSRDSSGMSSREYKNKTRRK